MIKVGMIGESQYDRDALQELLKKKFADKIQFVSLLRNVRGTQLDQAKTLNILRIEVEQRGPKAVIVQRDLDIDEKRAERDKFFGSIAETIGIKKFFLLHIFAIEALILADLRAFNEMYECEAKFDGNPQFQDKPKKWLQSKCKRGKYEPVDCPKLFGQLDIELVRRRVPYFNEFLKGIEDYSK